MGWVLYSTKWVKSVLYREPLHKTLLDIDRWLLDNGCI